MSLSVLFATIYQTVNNLDSQFTTMFQDNQILVVGPASEQASRKLVNEFGAEAVARLSIATLNGSILNVTSNAERVGSPRLANGDGNWTTTNVALPTCQFEFSIRSHFI